MKPTEIAAAILLVVCVFGNLLTSVGLVKTKNLYDQIHYLAPCSLLGAPCLAAAIVLHEGLTQGGAKAILIAVLLLLGNPVLSHATARAGKVRRENRISMTDGEGS